MSGIAPFLDRVIRGDCLEVMASIPDDSADLCFADPPFNLEKKYLSYKDRKPAGEYVDWCRRWLSEMTRIAKPSGAIVVHNIPKWLTYYAAILNELAHFRHWISWDAMSNPLGKTLLPAHYGLLFYTKSADGYKFFDVRAPHRTCRKCKAFLKDYGGKSDQRHPFGALVSDVWSDIHRIRHSNRRDSHPCQLPIHLMERVILMTTEPGDVALDPFLGTGTTAIAAKSLGRRYVGVDMDPSYADIAEAKLAETMESKEGDFFVSRFLGKIVSIRDVDAAKMYPPQLTAPEKRRRKNGVAMRVPVYGGAIPAPMAASAHASPRASG